MLWELGAWSSDLSPAQFRFQARPQANANSGRQPASVQKPLQPTTTDRSSDSTSKAPYDVEFRKINSMMIRILAVLYQERQLLNRPSRLENLAIATCQLSHANPLKPVEAPARLAGFCRVALFARLRCQPFTNHHDKYCATSLQAIGQVKIVLKHRYQRDIMRNRVTCYPANQGRTQRDEHRKE